VLIIYFFKDKDVSQLKEYDQDL